MEKRHFGIKEMHEKILFWEQKIPGKRSFWEQKIYEKTSLWEAYQFLKSKLYLQSDVYEISRVLSASHEGLATTHSFTCEFVIYSYIYIS